MSATATASKDSGPEPNGDGAASPMAKASTSATSATNQPFPPGKIL